MLKCFIRRCLGQYVLHSGYLKNNVTIFAYHDITDQPREFSQKYNLNVAPQRFLQQLRFIKKHFNIISADELIDGSFDRPAAMITFDDGFESYFTHSVPIMRELNIPSINFINGAPILGEVFWAGLILYLMDYDVGFRKKVFREISVNGNTPGYLRCDHGFVVRHLKTLDAEVIFEKVRQFSGPFLSIEQLNKLETEADVLIGNHLYNHFNVWHLSDLQLTGQYKKNQHFINQFGNARDYFSYPFGQPGYCFKQQQTERLQSMGAKLVFSSSNESNAMGCGPIYDRIGIYHRDQQLADLMGRMQLKRLKKRFGVK